MRRKIFLGILLFGLTWAPNADAQGRHAPGARDSWFGADKIKHFFMSAFIESLTFSGLQAVGAHRNTAFAGAVGVTAAFGIGKEFHDKRKGELFSIRDLTWDAAGAGAGLVMLRSTQR